MPGKWVNTPFSMGTMAKLLIIAYSVCVQVAVAEISTLFTTPQERQLIDANRYRSDAVEQNRRPVELPKEEVEVVSDLVREEVSNTYAITGIAVSNEGFHSAWINDQEYMDGDLIDNKIRLKIITGNDVKLRMITPDGKRYYGTSGEILEVTYLADVDD